MPDAPETTDDPAPHLLAGGRRLRPIGVTSGRYIFGLACGDTTVRLITRRAAPSETAPWLADDRRLGVMVSGLTCRTGGKLNSIPLDHPALNDGWWQPEWHGPVTLRRWTNGDAVVPLAGLAWADRAPCLLEVTIAGTVPYPVRRAAANRNAPHHDAAAFGCAGPDKGEAAIAPGARRHGPSVRRGPSAGLRQPPGSGKPSRAKDQTGERTMPDDDAIITRRDGRVGRVRLNRPRVLNTLTLDMVRTFAGTLEDFRDDPHVHAVVVEGAGDRAFCAGGDIRALRDGQLSGDRSGVEAFFREEYALNLMISAYPKPYVALIDGICMGGGIGVSVHGPYRVATEHAMFAMPETAIGFFPDIGGTFFLPRLPGQLGVYLGLTGLRTTGADAVHAGFATHFVSRARLPDLSAALAEIGVAAVARFAEPLPAWDSRAARGGDRPVFLGRYDFRHCHPAGSGARRLGRRGVEGVAWGVADGAGVHAGGVSAGG